MRVKNMEFAEEVENPRRETHIVSDRLIQY